MRTQGGYHIRKHMKSRIYSSDHSADGETLVRSRDARSPIENEIYHSSCSRQPMARTSSAELLYSRYRARRTLYLRPNKYHEGRRNGGCISRAWNLTSAKVCVNRFLALWDRDRRRRVQRLPIVSSLPRLSFPLPRYLQCRASILSLEENDRKRERDLPSFFFLSLSLSFLAWKRADLPKAFSRPCEF